jgi:catechol 2,3-dioxygenase-like lactoylglutathione lyase family enzyme
MEVKAIDLPVVQLPVRDLEKSVAWYQDTLGLGFNFEFKPGDDEAWLGVGRMGLGLIRCADVPKLDFYNAKGELSSIFTIQVENVHDVYETLKSRGIEVGDMLFRSGGGGYSFNLRDRDGHVLNIWGGWVDAEQE